MRVGELNGNFVIIACRLEIDTLLVIDASNIVHAHLQGLIVSNHALQLVLVCGEVATFVTLAMTFA